MKKKLFSIALASLMLVSCAKGGKEDTVSGDTSIWDTTIGDNVEFGIFEQGADKKHIIIEPKAEGYYTMKLKAIGSVSSKEDLEKFEQYYEKLFPDTFTPEEYDDEFRFIDYDYPGDPGVKYPYSYPKVSDRRAELENDEYINPYLTIENAKGSLTIVNGNLHIMQKGKTYALEDPSVSVLMYFPDQHHESAAIYLDPTNSDTYQLADKSLSVKDAAAAAEKYMDEIYSIENNDFKTNVGQVVAVKLGDKYGYSFRVTRSYKGIPFDYVYDKSPGYVGIRSVSNGKQYDWMPGYAFMNDSTDIDIIIGYTPRYNIEELEKVDRILSREECLSIVSKTYSDRVKLDIYKEELVYTAEFANEYGTEQIVRPAWKFSLVTENGVTLYTYVDAVSGDCWFIEPTPDSVG